MAWSRHRLYRLSVVLLAVVLAGVAADWLRVWWPVLTDPGLQIDDARTHLVGYHRFARDPLLTGDPVTGACLAMQPWLARLFYMAATPAVGLHAAAKVAQALCVAIGVMAAVLLARSRRWGLAAGAILGMASLIFPWWIGGTPRQFGPPLLALYIAGALARRMRVRFGAAVIAAGIYPSATILMLVTEGLLTLWRFRRTPRSRWPRLAAPAVAMAAACAALALLPKPGREALGPVVTLAEAKTNPDYRDGARRLILDISPNPISKSILEVVYEIGLLPVNPDDGERRALPHLVGAWLGVAMLAWLVATRRIRVPAAAPAFWIAGAALYWLACVVAFRLYLPQRYSEYGIGTGGIACLIGLLTQTRIPKRPAYIHRSVANFLVAACLAGLWIAWGRTDRFGDIANTARAPHAALYDLAASLPEDARFASHPYDGDDIPFWSGRASLCGYELDQPFFTSAWRASVERTRATFAALYATDRAEVLAFCARWNVTHLLLRPDRYRDDFRKRAKYCDPFDAENKALLREIDRERLALLDPPGEAIIFRDHKFLVVDVAALRAAWAAR